MLGIFLVAAAWILFDFPLFDSSFFSTTSAETLQESAHNE